MSRSNDNTNEAVVRSKEDWIVQRDAHKQLADDSFRGGDYQDAARQYTNALALDPTNHVLLSNRSAARLKLGEKSKALQDAKACVEHAPLVFHKAFSRLGAALQSLGRWDAARDAYNKVLQTDPKNPGALKGADECSRQVELQREKERAEQEKQSDKKNVESVSEMGAGCATEKDDTETDLLDDFFSEVEAASEPKSTVAPEEDAADTQQSRTNVVKTEKKGLGTAQSQIDRLLTTNYKWKNLNPFSVLDIPHTSSADDISRRYKALSLLLHPDKCGNLPRAKEAYDEVQRAKNQLNDQDKARHIRQLVAQGQKKGTTEWHANGKSESLHDVQRRSVQRLFAEIEYKRREVEERQRKQEERERQQEEEVAEKEKKERAFDRNWREEGRVDKRIGDWRDFQQKKRSKT